MALIHLFADESGNLDFGRKRGATRYFVLGTVILQDCSIGNSLLELRRTLAIEGIDFTREFHATDDHPLVRRRVFEALMHHDFRIDATIFEKSKVEPSLQGDIDQFYMEAWRTHARNVAPQVVTESDDMFVAVSQFQLKAKRKQIHRAIDEVCSEVVHCRAFRTAFWPASIDPCLQIADYCSWAIFRKWEHGDYTYSRLIESRISRELIADSTSGKHIADHEGSPAS